MWGTARKYERRGPPDVFGEEGRIRTDPKRRHHDDQEIHPNEEVIKKEITTASEALQTEETDQVLHDDHN